MTTLDIINPATGETLDQLVGATAADVDERVRRAAAAQPDWAAQPMHRRAAIITAFAELLQQQEADLARLLCQENGKVMPQAAGELAGASRVTRGFIARALDLHGDATRLDNQPGYERDLLLTQWEPLGVVVAITPFNFPVSLLIHKVIPALLMGNSVVVKPAEATPLTTLKILDALHRAGVPEDVVSAVVGHGGEIGDALTGHPQVAKVSFTGSAPVGKRVGASAMSHLARVTLELGGNDPAIVFDDADLDLACRMIVQSRFAVSGQVCCSNKRILVQAEVHDELRDRLAAAVGALRPGDPTAAETDLGPLITPAAAERVHQQVRQTVDSGARIVVGANEPDQAYYHPTLLDGVTAEMDIAQDMEVFGPVLPILKFTDEQEAVRVANASAYGLNGALFTRGLDRALRVADQLDVGTAVVNGGSFYRPDVLAFGGYKDSGVGREGLRDSLLQCAQQKNIGLRNVFGA